LTKLQVEQIKKINDGSLVTSEIVKIKSGSTFSKDLDIRENDVFLIKLIKI